MAHVHIRVSAKTKRKWKRIADESNEYRDLTHLITKCVNAQLSEPDEPGNPGGTSKELLDALESINRRIDDTNSTVNRLAQDIAELDAQLTGTEELHELAMDLLGHLPVVDEPEEVLQHDKGNYDPLTGMQQTGHIDYFLEYYSTHGSHTVYRALKYVTDEMDRAGKLTDENNEERYFREI